ncbi:MAG TPA: hypothetical protein VJV75_08150 [Candidatus Polarisedimenticolia bacterium]|nr:hypothetical protein [Candidatus Polarisedimenticolia bacterium]
MPGDFKGKLVAHLKDGQVYKGFSRDFIPGQNEFHLVRRRNGVAASQAIRVEELKALFQVKTWGRKDRHLGSVGGFPEDGPQPPASDGYVRTVAEFYDGEKIYGFSRDYDPAGHGFSLIPADPEDNNARIYVLNSSLVNIQIIRE